MYLQNWQKLVAVYKDLNLEFVTKNSFCHEFAARSHVHNVHNR